MAMDTSAVTDPDAWPVLTEHQRRILELLCQGLTDGQIATRASVSVHTVNFHLRRLFAKFDVHSRVQLAAIYSSRVRAVF